MFMSSLTSASHLFCPGILRNRYGEPQLHL
uniref:Uncharacterized protein n=1 Tax=Anguilla anguilla TaxID=7936 RepID=A0A0E9RR04_ANGAN